MGYRVWVRDWDEKIYIEMPDKSPHETFKRLAANQAYLRAYAEACHRRTIAKTQGKIRALRGCK